MRARSAIAEEEAAEDADDRDDAEDDPADDPADVDVPDRDRVAVPGGVVREEWGRADVASDVMGDAKEPAGDGDGEPEAVSETQRTAVDGRMDTEPAGSVSVTVMSCEDHAAPR